MFRTTLISICLICSVTPAQFNVLHEDFALLASDGAENDRFGIKVAISGDLAIVGAYNHDDKGEDSGAAYIYRFEGDQWVEEVELLASDGMAFDEFGLTVSISGNTAIVGAHSVDDNGEDSGAAYIYRLNGEEWQEEAKLLASDGEAFDNFGLRVCISGDTAIVGAYRDDENGSDSGSAYIYRFNGKQWIEETKLLASDGASVDLYGRAVAISNGIALVGARLDDDNGQDSGSAYIYRFDGNQWMEEIKLLASDGSYMDNFGHSVSISGETVIIGARQGGTYNAGSAYIFRFNGKTWIEEAVLVAGDGSTFDEFGHSVSISGDIAVVGAGGDDDIGVNSGSAYIFRYFENEWIRTKLHASDGAPYDTFGLTTSISGDTAIVGSRSHDGVATNSGAAYIYNIGDIWSVDDDGKADFDNIQEAVDAASNGDEIIVMPGTYSTTGLAPSVDMLGKAVWLHSSGGQEVTIIDGEGVRRGILCDSGETSKTIIEGFTISNGIADVGGGMYNYGSSPTLTNCMFTNNTASNDGGGMYNDWNSNPTLIGCTFTNNTAVWDGGGMFNNNNSSPTLTNCTFTDNHIPGEGGGIYNWTNSSPTLTNCTFSNNSAGVIGGGMLNDSNASPTITNCTFANNTAPNGGGMYNYNNSSPTLTDTTVCGNTPDQIVGSYTDGGGNTIADKCECQADINGDGHVNVSDLLTIVDQWGLTDSPADVNADGIVDVTDLLIVVGNWGPCE